MVGIPKRKMEVCTYFADFSPVSNWHIRFAGRHIVTVAVDMPAPPSPVFLQRGKGIESAGIHIGDAVLLMEVGEVFQKALAAIGQPGRGGKARASADEAGICALYLSFQPLTLL